MSYIHTWHNGHNMVENSNTLVEKDKAYGIGELPSVLIGSAVGGPVGAAVGLGLNKLWQWGRQKYLDKKDDKKNKKNDDKKGSSDSSKDDKPEAEKKYTDEELNQKIKQAQDEIKNSGIFEPEVYKNHTFYQTKIYDRIAPDTNNFVFMSKNKTSGKKAYENFLDYWTQRYKEKRKLVSDEDAAEFKKLVKERFQVEANTPCLITVPQLFFMDRADVLSMAKNSDILGKEGVVYYDKPSFDSNYYYDLHMYKNKNEGAEDTKPDLYKISLITFSAYGRDYNYAFDFVQGEKETDDESQKVILDLGEQLTNDSKDTQDALDIFTKFLDQIMYNEKIITDVYTVATPLLRKDSTNAHDLEYNAALLDGVGIYNSEEEFIKNYMEDYQKLLENQMGI